MTEKALVKPASEPYRQIIPESSWGTWIRAHIEKYIAMGWTLIKNYEPISSNDEDELI